MEHQSSWKSTTKIQKTLRTTQTTTTESSWHNCCSNKAKLSYLISCLRDVTYICIATLSRKGTATASNLVCPLPFKVSSFCGFFSSQQHIFSIAYNLYLSFLLCSVQEVQHGSLNSQIIISRENYHLYRFWRLQNDIQVNQLEK